MKYYLYLKSKTPLSDYEADCEADSKKEALKIFMEDPALIDWDDSDIMKNIFTQEEIDEAVYDDALESEATGN